MGIRVEKQDPRISPSCSCHSFHLSSLAGGVTSAGFWVCSCWNQCYCDLWLQSEEQIPHSPVPSSLFCGKISIVFLTPRSPMPVFCVSLKTGPLISGSAHAHFSFSTRIFVNIAPFVLISSSGETEELESENTSK